MSQHTGLYTFETWLRSRNPWQTEFQQAVMEVASSILPHFEDDHPYRQYRVLERLTEPDRLVAFRVVWQNDQGEIEINRGWRVQQSNLVGPYKGGIRFHPTVDESTLKFLAFEQCFKNALTGMQLGGAKGGADFDPKGRSDDEIRRFCQAFMQELYRHIGPHTDIPAGDIGVNGREIGYLYGHYKRLVNQFEGALTGKEIEFGGSHVRTEATGFGLIYFVEQMLKAQDDTLKNKRVLISGAGNVASYAAKKAIAKGAKVLSLSNSRGYLFVDEGLSDKHIEWIIAHSDEENSLAAFAQAHQEGKYIEDQSPWGNKADIALPCATQNEIKLSHAEAITNAGVTLVAEGANMPCDDAAISHFRAREILYAPGKASNAGGVALSGLEMAQNSSFTRRSFDSLDEELQATMAEIHQKCVEHGQQKSTVDYVLGANLAGFKVLADAMIKQGY